MIANEIVSLTLLTLPELQKMWERYFDAPATSRNKEFYISRIAYRMQELQYGGVATSIKQMLISLCEKQQKTKRESKLPPIDTRLVKIYKGTEHTVTILKDGFDYNGMTYKTLSAISQLITGHKISGNFFFGLTFVL